MDSGEERTERGDEGTELSGVDAREALIMSSFAVWSSIS
jgi:hypothetical protein